MKKIFYLLSISMLLLQGCSSDSDNNDNNNGSSAILCKSIRYNESDATNTRNYRDEFTYVGNKFNERKDYYNDVLTSKSVYIYTGNLITQVKRYDENNIYNSLSTITYNNSGLPISILNIDNETGSWVGYKSNFVYNQNGTITELSYSGDVNTQNTLDETTTYTLQNNILVSQITIVGTYTTSYSFTYDTKNSPFKNVIGFNNFFSVGNQEHNLLQTIEINGANSPIIENFQYIYNSDGYPTSRLPPCSSCSITEYIY